MSDFSTNVKNFMVGAALVPLGGLLAHEFTRDISDYNYSTAKLSHRFECAYCINVPESHKTYTYEDPYTYEEQTTTYWASPFATYPAMLALGCLGMRRRWYEKLKDKCR